MDGTDSEAEMQRNEIVKTAGCNEGKSDRWTDRSIKGETILLRNTQKQIETQRQTNTETREREENRRTERRGEQETLEKYIKLRQRGRQT